MDSAKKRESNETNKPCNGSSEKSGNKNDDEQEKPGTSAVEENGKSETRESIVKSNDGNSFPNMTGYVDTSSDDDFAAVNHDIASTNDAIKTRDTSGMAAKDDILISASKIKEDLSAANKTHDASFEKENITTSNDVFQDETLNHDLSAIENETYAEELAKENVKICDSKNYSADESQTRVHKFPNYEEFCFSCRHQSFSFSDSIIYYIAKNPSNATVYQNLIQTCKHFFMKNPILVYHCLLFDEDSEEWETCVERSCLDANHRNAQYRKIDLDLKKNDSKIWVIHKLKICCFIEDLTSLMVSKLYNGDLNSLHLAEQTLSQNDLMFFSKTTESLNICTCAMEDANCDLIEIILTNFRMLKHLWFMYDRVEDWSSLAKQLQKNRDHIQLHTLRLTGANETFDISTFYDYLKTNSQIKVDLGYFRKSSREYEDKLQAICDEILGAKSSRPYKPPFIYYNGQILSQ